MNDQKYVNWINSSVSSVRSGPRRRTSLRGRDQELLRRRRHRSGFSGRMAAKVSREAVTSSGHVAVVATFLNGRERAGVYGDWRKTFNGRMVEAVLSRLCAICLSATMTVLNLLTRSELNRCDIGFPKCYIPVSVDWVQDEGSLKENVIGNVSDFVGWEIDECGGHGRRWRRQLGRKLQ